MVTSANHLLRRQIQPLVLASALAGLSALLASCGGGGGASTTDSTGTTDPTTPTPTLSTLTLTLPTTSLGPANLAVIVSTGDPVSEAVAAQYQAARGIPAANIIHVTLPATTDAISDTQFATLKASIDAQLPSNVQATLLTWAAPSRVTGSVCSMSITSAMAFGYNAGYCNAPTACAATIASPYFDSESGQPFTDLKMRPSMMLGTSTLAAATALTQLGVSADNTQPSGDGYLIRTTDTMRNVRYTDYIGLPAQWAGTLNLNYIDNAGGTSAGDSISGKTNVLFYFTGLPIVPNIATNSYRPGAIADALTSFGALLPGANGQTPITSWLAAGVTGTYGTVEEPCNYTQKFSQASTLIDHYWRGGTLIEAYWKSVQWPGQGLFIGEPLAQPFRDAPSFTMDTSDYIISTRALRTNAHYELDYQTSSAGAWISLGSFTTASKAQVQTLRVPRPPSTATKIRWVGPCPSNAAQSCTLATSS